LTASEVADLDLSGTQLVVLSACESGLSVDNDATGPYDLAHAFRLAGARSVVAATWNIDDRATAIFMDAFYRSLLDGRSVSTALSRARSRVRATPGYAHPFYWAGFELVGENIVLGTNYSTQIQR
jgi:CHAT domain-containing protein